MLHCCLLSGWWATTRSQDQDLDLHLHLRLRPLPVFSPPTFRPRPRPPPSPSPGICSTCIVGSASAAFSAQLAIFLHFSWQREPFVATATPQIHLPIAHTFLSFLHCKKSRRLTHFFLYFIEFLLNIQCNFMKICTGKNI